jgi:hypothetical protein
MIHETLFDLLGLHQGSFVFQLSSALSPQLDDPRNQFPGGGHYPPNSGVESVSSPYSIPRSVPGNS